MAHFRRKPPVQSSIDISEERGVRYLHFGSDWVQGAMRVARPWALELAYTREMMFPLLLGETPSWPRSVLLVGLGAGSQLKFLYRNLPDCKLTVVEINPQVEYIAQQYFKVPDDPKRIDMVIADGADYLLGGGKNFDLILLDGFDADATSGALDTLPFYQACRARLTETGIVSINLLGRNRGFAASVERIRSAFDQRVLALPACDSGNVAVLAGDLHPVSGEALQQRAASLNEASGLDLKPTIDRMVAAGLFPGGTLRI